MKDKISLIIVSPNSKRPMQLSFSKMISKVLLGLGTVCSFTFGYFIFDYVSLLELENKYQTVQRENSDLKNEVSSLVGDLGDLTDSLERMETYIKKLEDITQVKMNLVKKKTGLRSIGPLNKKEFAISQDFEGEGGSHLPPTLEEEQVFFKPVFEKVGQLRTYVKEQSIELNQLLYTLGKHSLLLASMPSHPPVNGWITSGYGQRISPFTGEVTRHMGLDIASSIGAPINAPADGVVIFSGEKDGFGNFIMLAHGYGIVTRYGHNAQNMVTPGQRVKRGEQIATIGMTGRTTGPHLHYEVLVNGMAVDPRSFLLNLSEKDHILSAH